MQPEEGAQRSRRITLAMLFIVSMFNYIDRTIISILQEPIKADLGLNDAQLGAITGLSFALFYATLSLPIATYADRTNRKALISGSLGLWSAMTALCGLATSFASLVFFRIGVAVGEAGSVPASHSIIADLYPKQRRATALALWGVALPAGILVGFAMSGWLVEYMGWRQAFAVFGAAGILLVPVVLVLAKEPRRGAFDTAAKNDVAAVPIMRALAILWNLKSARWLIIGATLHAFTQYSIMNWTAPFYVRVHGLSIGETGTWLALFNGIGGGLGIYLGGYLSDVLGEKNPRARFWVSATAFVLMAAAAAVQYLAPSVAISLVFASVSTALMFCYYGPVIAVLHSMVSPGMRAVSSAILLLVFNLIGLGLGPYLTGVLSDYLAADLVPPNESLRFALTVVLAGSVAAAVFWYAAGRAYAEGSSVAREGGALEHQGSRP